MTNTYYIIWHDVSKADEIHDENSMGDYSVRVVSFDTLTPDENLKKVLRQQFGNQNLCKYGIKIFNEGFDCSGDFIDRSTDYHRLIG